MGKTIFDSEIKIANKNKDQVKNLLNIKQFECKVSAAQVGSSGLVQVSNLPDDEHLTSVQ